MHQRKMLSPVFLLASFNKWSSMSLSQKNLSSVQRAGQAIHDASEAIAATMRAQAESMVASVASQPFGVESEQSIARFKILARLSQGLATVEAQLQELYSMATDLANPASDVIALPALTKRKTANAAAVDVVAKPAKATKATKVARAKKGGLKNSALTANDSTLLQYLQGVLKAGEWTSHTGAVMAAGSGLPLGSVGVSLKKILASGAVKAGERGMYQLGADATIPEVKRAPVKKPKVVAVKKAKAVKSEASASPEANVKPAKKAKVVVATKPKAVAPKKVKPASAPVTDVPASTEAALV